MKGLTGVRTPARFTYMNTAPAAPYAATQAVEVLVTNFATPGMPKVWVAGEVTKVELLNEARRLWDVTVARVDGHLSVQVVGPRGGNKNVRSVVAA